MEKQMTADEVINLYQDFRSRKRLSDQYLAENCCETRKDNDGDLVGDYVYGIVFLRDDGVDILIDEIHKLRERMKPKKLRRDSCFFVCPNCNADWLARRGRTIYNDQNFCWNCGQALDWSE